MKYVLAFRGQVGRRLTAEEEGRWPMWSVSYTHLTLPTKA